MSQKWTNLHQGFIYCLGHKLTFIRPTKVPVIACLGIIITTRHPSYPRIRAYITHVIFDTRHPTLLTCVETIRETDECYHTRSVHSGFLTTNSAKVDMECTEDREGIVHTG